MPPHIVQLAPPLKLMARAIFERTMAEVDVGRAVRRNLSVNASKIQVGSACFDLADLAEIVIVAIGKAAAPMYEAAAAVLQEAPGFRMPVEAMVVSPSAPRQGAGPVSYFAGAHPCLTRARARRRGRSSTASGARMPGRWCSSW